MFHSGRLNNKINCIHERPLTITYQDNASTFQELLNKDNFMLKIQPGLSPEILRETFVSKTSSYNLRLKNLKCALYFTVLNRYRF